MGRIDKIRARLAACDQDLYLPEERKHPAYVDVWVNDHGDGKFVASFNPNRLEWRDLLLAAQADLAYLLGEVERLTAERDTAHAAHQIAMESVRQHAAKAFTVCVRDGCGDEDVADIDQTTGLCGMCSRNLS